MERIFIKDKNGNLKETTLDKLIAKDRREKALMERTKSYRRPDPSKCITNRISMLYLRDMGDTNTWLQLEEVGGNTGFTYGGSKEVNPVTGWTVPKLQKPKVVQSKHAIINDTCNEHDDIFDEKIYRKLNNLNKLNYG